APRSVFRLSVLLDGGRPICCTTRVLVAEKPCLFNELGCDFAVSRRERHSQTDSAKPIPGRSAREATHVTTYALPASKYGRTDHPRRRTPRSSCANAYHHRRSRGGSPSGS